MNKSDTIGELAGALAAVQGKLKPASFNAVNPFLKNRYADLGAITEAARELLAANGLAYVQMPTAMYEGDDNIMALVGLTTTLIHKSGEWVSGTIFLPLEAEKGKSPSQAAGSIITYLRRYALASMLGIVADEDTDGNQPPTLAKRSASNQPQARTVEKVNEELFGPEHKPANGQARTVATVIADAGWPEREALAKLNSKWPGKPEGKTLKLTTPMKPETAAAAAAWLEEQLTPVE